MRLSVRLYRFFAFGFIGFFAALLLLMACVTAVFDPLHMLSKPQEKDVYDRESRYAMPGIVHFNESDHIFFGTSIIQDFDEVYYEQASGSSVARYFFTGGSAYEQRRLLETLLETEHKPKRIYWGLDAVSFTGDLQRIRWAQFPEYLYDPTPSLLRYVFSYESFYRLLRQLPDRFYFKNGYVDEANRVRPKYKFGKEQLYKTYCGERLQARIERLHEFDFSTQEQQISEHLIDIMRAHPDVEFVLFFPPYSLLQFAEYQEADVIDSVLAFRELVYDSASMLSNVRFYDFQSDRRFITDFEEFRDSVHMSPKASQSMSDLLLSGKSVSRKALLAGSGFLRSAASRDGVWRKAESYCAAQSKPIIFPKN